MSWEISPVLRVFKKESLLKVDLFPSLSRLFNGYCFFLSSPCLFNLLVDFVSVGSTSLK